MKLTNTDPALLSAINQLLSEHLTGLREIELMNLLDAQYPSLFPRPDLSDRMMLFQHHFMLRHHLYCLQQQLADDGQWWLDISLVTITKRPATPSTGQKLAEFDGVRDYYLDLENLAKESAQSVDELINSFWTALQKHYQAPQAYAVLGLSGDEGQAEIRQRVRELNQQHHPDKGGDPETFRTIQHAWAQLKKN